MLSWNVRSIKNATRKDLIFEYINAIPKANLNVIYLQETHLNSKVIIENSTNFATPPHKKGGV